MPSLVLAEDDVKRLQDELRQANESVTMIQKLYDGLKQRNSELERENAYLKNQLILREAELQSMNANYGASHPNNTGQTTPPTNNQVKNNPQTKNQPPLSQSGKPKPASTTEVGKLTPVHDLTLYVGSSGVEMYAGPGSNYPRLMKLQEGAVLNVEATQGEWFKVLTIGGIIGFVHKKYVTSTKPNAKGINDGQEAF